jgi:hypothetical protein
MSLGPGMTATLAQVRARGSQLGLTTAVLREERGRSARGEGELNSATILRLITGPERGWRGG